MVLGAVGRSRPREGGVGAPPEAIKAGRAQQPARPLCCHPTAWHCEYGDRWGGCWGRRGPPGDGDGGAGLWDEEMSSWGVCGGDLSYGGNGGAGGGSATMGWVLGGGRVFLWGCLWKGFPLRGRGLLWGGVPLGGSPFGGCPFWRGSLWGGGMSLLEGVRFGGRPFLGGSVPFGEGPFWGCPFGRAVPFGGGSFWGMSLFGGGPFWRVPFGGGSFLGSVPFGGGPFWGGPLWGGPLREMSLWGSFLLEGIPFGCVPGGVGSTFLETSEGSHCGGGKQHITTEQLRVGCDPEGSWGSVGGWAPL